MASHPNGPATIGHPRKHWRSKEAVELDATRLLEFLRADPLKNPDGSAIATWLGKQDEEVGGWTPGYQQMVRDRALAALRLPLADSADQLRSDIMRQCRDLLPACRGWKFGKGSGEHSGTEILLDPDTNERLTEVDHKAVQGYLRIIAELAGLIIKDKGPTVVVNVGDVIQEAQRRLDAELSRQQVGALTAPATRDTTAEVVPQAGEATASTDPVDAWLDS